MGMGVIESLAIKLLRKHLLKHLVQISFFVALLGNFCVTTNAASPIRQEAETLVRHHHDFIGLFELEVDIRAIHFLPAQVIVKLDNTVTELRLTTTRLTQVEMPYQSAWRS